MQAPREVVFEFVRIGHVIRVSALDSSTLQEVTIQGPASAGEAALRRTAMAKLDYVNRKREPRGG